MKLIEKFGLIDGLTGVNNRRSYDQTIPVEWSAAMRSQEPLGMLMVDVDKFKAFNDRFGHVNGDVCLKAISDVMVKSVLRGNDYVFRWGGEEFAILLPSTSIEGVQEVAERVRKNIAETPIKCGDETTFVTVSIGAGSIVPPQENNYKKSLEAFTISVDNALYKAKANGRNRVELES